MILAVFGSRFKPSVLTLGVQRRLSCHGVAVPETHGSELARRISTLEGTENGEHTETPIQSMRRGDGIPRLRGSARGRAGQDRPRRRILRPRGAERRALGSRGSDPGSEARRAAREARPPAEHHPHHVGRHGLRRRRHPGAAAGARPEHAQHQPDGGGRHPVHAHVHRGGLHPEPRSVRHRPPPDAQRHVQHRHAAGEPRPPRRGGHHRRGAVRGRLHDRLSRQVALGRHRAELSPQPGLRRGLFHRLQPDPVALDTSRRRVPMPPWG